MKSKIFLTLALGCATLSLSAATARYQTPANHRIEQTINREWTFNYFPAENADTAGCEAPQFDDSKWPAIALPHTWSTYETTGKLHPFIHDASEKDDPYWWNGWGWYRKHFSVGKEESARRVYVEFDGVQKYSKIFVNGKFIGDHKGGYNGFEFDITDAIRFGEDNVLAVAVNAKQNDAFKIPPMSAGNWNTYGGIYRDARIVIKDALHIPFQGSYKHEGGTFVTTPQVSDDSATVNVKTWVENNSASARECELRTTIADADGTVIETFSQKKNIAPGATIEFDQTSTPIAQPHLWSPETPYVYKVFSDVLQSGVAVDHFESPLGFRWFKWDYENDRLILNGKKVIIHGSNHHQEWPWLGDATPKWMLLADMFDFRVNLNNNFMRTAHYPNDPAIYDFNDHYGIITIEELPNDKRQEFSQAVQVQQLRETIRRDRNHPAIFFWSMGNETDHAVDSKYAVAEDATRLIHARDIYNDSAGKFVNTLSKNIALESLLRCTIRGWPDSDVRDLEPQSAQQTGTEEWQHDLAAVDLIKRNRGRARDDLANLNTWLYEDHGCNRKYVNCPLDFVNPKGWVDCWRVPKYMYYLWQAFYSDKPMVFIHPHFWTSRYVGQKKEIVVDSNCDSVELFVNNRSAGILKPTLETANVVRFENVPVTDGSLTAIGRKNNLTVTNTVAMSGPPARLELNGFMDGKISGLLGATTTIHQSSNPSIQLAASLDSLAIMRAEIVDARGNHVFGATNALYWSVSGPATLAGAAVYQSDTDKNEAKEGTMYIAAPTLNIIRSSGEPGEIKVQVRSPGLTPAEIIIVATNALKNSSVAIIEPPLPKTQRVAVARENHGPRHGEFAELHGITDDISVAESEDYSRWIDDFLRDKNPALDFDGPEYHAVVSVFARLMQTNHGNLIRDDFNFIAGAYNECRRITRELDSLQLPAETKQSLREQYAHEMIGKGEAKDYAKEILKLKSLAKQKPLAAADEPPFDAARASDLRKQICENFFVPNPLPTLDAKTHRTFSPASGVKAEAVSYTTEFGLNVPGILYLPDPLPAKKIPAFVVVNGHGGDKYSWYSWYTGILFARGGAAVLTYDQIGEGERNINRKSGTRAHDFIQGDSVLARHLAGLMITDAMQAVSYLRQRPEIDPQRIAVGGYSLGSFVVALAGAVDPRIHACVLAGGGNLDGPNGYWDKSNKQMCQALPYQSLTFLGDRPAVIYALHAARGPTLIFNGLGDTVVGIPSHGEKFFEDLRARTARMAGGTNGVFECGFAPANCGHRPYWLTRPVVQWLNQEIGFPNWSAEKIASMPEIKISDWAAASGVAMDKLYATDLREGGTPALDSNVPGYTRDELDALTTDEWNAQKRNYILETWLAAVKNATNPVTAGVSSGNPISP